MHIWVAAAATTAAAAAHLNELPVALLAAAQKRLEIQHQHAKAW
jgi:hypothetical protein